MKKSSLIAISLLGISLILSSCSTLSGIEKEKTSDGFIKSHDLVYDTVKYEHPALVPNFGIGKFNVYQNKQFENIQAYILNDSFYLEADYGNKSRNTLNIDTIMFFTKRNKIALTNKENLPNTYHKFSGTDGLTYENLKVILTPEEMNLLGRFLIADEVYISFAGERGRTDLFKLSNKLKKSMLAIINKWNSLNNVPVIQEEQNTETAESTENNETTATPETIETTESTESNETTVNEEASTIQE